MVSRKYLFWSTPYRHTPKKSSLHLNSPIPQRFWLRAPAAAPGGKDPAGVEEAGGGFHRLGWLPAGGTSVEFGDAVIQMGLGRWIVAVGHAEMDGAVPHAPHLCAQLGSRDDRRGEAAFEARQPFGLTGDEGGDEVAHRDAGGAHAVGDRTRKAGLLRVGPVDVLLVPVAHQAIDERPVQAVHLLVEVIGRAVGDLHWILGRPLAAEPAVVDAAVIGVDCAEMGAVGAVGLADLLRQGAAPLAAIPDGLLGDVGLDMVAHLEGRVEAHVDAVMQRSGVVVAVVESARHLLVDGERDAEDGKHLQIGVGCILLVDVLEVDLAIPPGSATECADLQIAEVIVADERPEQAYTVAGAPVRRAGAVGAPVLQGRLAEARRPSARRPYSDTFTTPSSASLPICSGV